MSVVDQNLTNSFPTKSREEIVQIRDKFYRHFCDITAEGLKIFGISEQDAHTRFKVTNPEILDPYFRDGQSVIIVGGHYNNWEMLAVGIDKFIKHDSVAIYHKLKNEFMNDKALKSRSKYGLKMIARQEVKEHFENDEHVTATIFGADQSPSMSKKVYWMDFLNQDTPVMFGVEKFAKEKDLPVFFGGIEKVKRGYYQLNLELLVENPSQFEYGQITEAHTKRLEKQILAIPEYWLWSHRRWKRKRKEGE